MTDDRPSVTSLSSQYSLHNNTRDVPGQQQLAYINKAESITGELDLAIQVLYLRRSAELEQVQTVHNTHSELNTFSYLDSRA